MSAIDVSKSPLQIPLNKELNLFAYLHIFHLKTLSVEQHYCDVHDAQYWHKFLAISARSW